MEVTKTILFSLLVSVTGFAGGTKDTTSAYNAFEKLSRSFTANQSGYLYIYVANESNAIAAASVYFDETYIVHEKNNVTLQVLQTSDYYPFGLSFNQYQADRLKETSPGNYAPELRNRYLFQGQELQKDLDLGWYQFKWRMHDPAIGRFGAVDPLAENFLHNGTYVFSENRLINGVELEGLEYVPRFDRFEYGDNGFLNTLKVGGNVLTDVFNILPDAWNSGVASYEKISDEGFGSYLNAVGDEFGAMGAGIKNSVIGQFNYATKTPFSQQLSDTYEGFKNPASYEAPLAFGVALFTTKNFSGSLTRTSAASEASSVNISGQVAKTESNLWRVGKYNELRGLEAGLDAHHVGQKALMQKFTIGYSPNTAPSILVPKIGHTQGVGVLSRTTNGFSSARQVLARDIFELRRVYPSIPNSSLQELIQLNKTMYPGAFIKQKK